MKPFVQNKILEKLPLAEGEDVYLGWKDPPINPVLFLRLFNLTNEREFLAGREKAKLVEVGPYAYKQEIHKVDVHYPRADDEIAYRMHKVYQFNRALSVGDDTEDVVVVPNIPLFGAMAKMEAESEFAKDMFVSILESYEFAKDTKPFLTLTVREFLFGYESVIMSLSRANDPRCAAERSVGRFGNRVRGSFPIFGDQKKGPTGNYPVNPGGTDEEVHSSL